MRIVYVEDNSRPPLPCSSSGEATDVGKGPIQSQGSVLLWNQPSYSKQSVKRTTEVDKYKCTVSVILPLAAALDSVIARTLGSLLVLTTFVASPESH